MMVFYVALVMGLLLNSGWSAADIPEQFSLEAERGQHARVSVFETGTHNPSHPAFKDARIHVDETVVPRAFENFPSYTKEAYPDMPAPLEEFFAAYQHRKAARGQAQHGRTPHADAVLSVLVDNHKHRGVAPHASITLFYPWVDLLHFSSQHKLWGMGATSLQEVFSTPHVGCDLSYPSFYQAYDPEKGSRCASFLLKNLPEAVLRQPAVSYLDVFEKMAEGADVINCSTFSFHLLTRLGRKNDAGQVVPKDVSTCTDSVDFFDTRDVASDVFFIPDETLRRLKDALIKNNVVLIIAADNWKRSLSDKFVAQDIFLRLVSADPVLSAHCVIALNWDPKTKALSSSSNFPGSNEDLQRASLAAPGVWDEIAYGVGYEGGWTANGTSYAAPYLTGVGALIQSWAVSQTGARLPAPQVVELMKTTAHKEGYDNPVMFGNGLINPTDIHGALKARFGK